MPSKVLPLIARVQDSNFSDVFGFTYGDDLILGLSTESVTYTLQRRADDGSGVWADTDITGSLSTTANTLIPFSTLKPVLGSVFLFRLRLSAPARVWVAVDPGTTEFELGSVDAPLLYPPASNQFIPVIWPPIPGDSELDSLPNGSVVLLVMAGQSNWFGGGPDSFSETWPETSKYWTGTELRPINSANGYRSNANPTPFLALAFEAEYPDLELWIVEDGEGGSGFHSDKWEVGGELRTRFLDKVESAFSYATAQSRGIWFAGTLWNQGAGDAYTPHDVAYGAALAGLVEDIYEITVDGSPFIPVRLGINRTNLTGLEVVRAVHESYPLFTDVDDIPLWTDDTHYDEEGYELYGQAQYGSLKLAELTKISIEGPLVPWLPTMEPSLRLFLDYRDASSLTMSGSNVTQWRDKSANGYAYNATGTLPLGADGVQFSANGSLSASTRLGLGANSAFSAVFLTKNISAGTDANNLMLIGSPTLGVLLMRPVGLEGQVGVFRYGGNKVFDASPGGNLISTFYQTENATFEDIFLRQNGVEQTKVGGGGTVVSNNVGESSVIGDAAWNFTLPAVLVFASSNLQLIERAEGWYAHEFGEAAQLPVNHPFKNSPPMVAAPTNLELSFAGVSSLPTGVTLTGSTPDYQDDFTEIVRTGTNNWGLAYLTGPEMDWATYDIEIVFNTRGLGAVGLSDEYTGGLFNAVGESLMVTRAGNVIYKSNTLGSLTQQIDFKQYSLTFRRIGNDVLITQKNITDDTAATTFTATNVNLTAPRAVLDSAYTNQRVVSISEVQK